MDPAVQDIGFFSSLGPSQLRRAHLHCVLCHAPKLCHTVRDLEALRMMMGVAGWNAGPPRPSSVA